MLPRNERLAESLLSIRLLTESSFQLTIRRRGQRRGHPFSSLSLWLLITTPPVRPRPFARPIASRSQLQIVQYSRARRTPAQVCVMRMFRHLRSRLRQRLQFCSPRKQAANLSRSPKDRSRLPLVARKPQLSRRKQRGPVYQGEHARRAAHAIKLAIERAQSAVAAQSLALLVSILQLPGLANNAMLCPPSVQRRKRSHQRRSPQPEPAPRIKRGTDLPPSVPDFLAKKAPPDVSLLQPLPQPVFASPGPGSFNTQSRSPHESRSEAG